MPPQYARGKARGTRSCGLYKPASGLNDLQEAAGDLEIADRVGRQPCEVVVFIVQDGFPGHPAGRKRHDHIVAAAGRRQHFAPAGEAQNFDSQPGFLIDFAVKSTEASVTNFQSDE